MLQSPLRFNRAGFVFPVATGNGVTAMIQTHLFLRAENALVQIDAYVRFHGLRLVRITYTRLHARVVFLA